MSSSPEPSFVADICVIGLGEIGGGIARFLAASGLRCAGHDLDAAALSRAAAAGVQVFTELSEAVAAAPLIVSSLPSEHAVRQVYLHAGGLVDVGADMVSCDLSTVSISLARQLHAARLAAGGQHVEGALIGVGHDAERGDLHLLLAGDDAAFASLEPLLRVAGKGYARFGQIGHANLAKILNNGVGQATLAAAAEAVTVARLAGLDPVQLVNSMIVGHGAGYSVVLERHGRAMAADQDGPGPARLSVKDAKALAEAVAPHPAAAPLLARTAQTLISAVAQEGCERQAVAMARRAFRLASATHQDAAVLRTGAAQ